MRREEADTESRRGVGADAPAPRTVSESLERLEAESWDLYRRELRRLDAPEPEEETHPDWNTPMGQFLRSDAEHPLGWTPGMPTGSPIAGTLEESRSHRERWMLVLRWDPCAYCGRFPASTIDHIEPVRWPNRETHTWLNYTGACASCNGNKAIQPMLLWLRARSRSLARRTRRLAAARLAA